LLQYLGGKSRIAKPLSLVLNNLLEPKQPFVDLFCGSCNIISKIDNDRVRIANDKHPYLIAMWLDLRNGRTFPESVSEEMYQFVKANKDADPGLTGFIGFGCSFAGKWFGGYCKNNTGRNYAKNAVNSLNKKMIGLDSVSFTNKDYCDLIMPSGSLVYCDIPYRGTTAYSKSLLGVFDHLKFYDWVRKKVLEGYKIYISEYKRNVPEDFKIVFELESKTDIRNRKGNRIKTTEVLITLR
jgi:DNA adenine methylase